MVALNLTVPLAVDFSSAADYFIFLINLLVCTSSFLVAGSVVLGILNKKSLRAQNRFIFMLNTSISDTLTGLGGYYTGLFDVYESYPPRNGTYLIVPSLRGVNIWTIMFAQLDRFLAVAYPYTYNRYVTRNVVIGICVFCWAYTYLFITIQYHITIEQSTRMYAYATLSFQVIVTAKVALTIKLYLIAKYQIAREPPGPERDSKKESLRLIIVVVVCFLTLWSPQLYYIIVVHATGSRYMFRNNANDPLGLLVRFTATSTPGLYIWGSPALKESVLKTVWGRVCPLLRRR
nr:PREDICTED: uncharacterized protein LOC107079712 [Lepisosteus oculatus]